MPGSVGGLRPRLDLAAVVDASRHGNVGPQPAERRQAQARLRSHRRSPRRRRLPSPRLPSPRRRRRPRSRPWPQRLGPHLGQVSRRWAIEPRSGHRSRLVLRQRQARENRHLGSLPADHQRLQVGGKLHNNKRSPRTVLRRAAKNGDDCSASRRRKVGGHGAEGHAERQGVCLLVLVLVDVQGKHAAYVRIALHFLLRDGAVVIRV